MIQTFTSKQRDEEYNSIRETHVVDYVTALREEVSQQRRLLAAQAENNRAVLTAVTNTNNELETLMSSVNKTKTVDNIYSNENKPINVENYIPLHSINQGR